MKTSMIMFGLFAALAGASASASNGLPSTMAAAQTCAAAFHQSGASGSCRLTGAQESANNYCQITASCTRNNGSVRGALYQGSKNNVPRLQNCDGNLRVGSC